MTASLAPGRKAALVALLLGVSWLVTFFAGAFSYKHNLHHKIPGSQYLKTLVSGGSPGAQAEAFYQAPEQGTSEVFQKAAVQYPLTFIVYGDSREPAGHEKDALITRIIEEKPAFVVHLGDMVLCGDEHQWRIFDLFEGRMRDGRIPLFPVLGNHEYYTRDQRYAPRPADQLQCYFRRFRFLKNLRWYSFQYGNCRFLVLDTNTDYSPGSHQGQWLMSQLKKGSPGFLFVAFHHPPYTRSGLGRKQEKILPKLFESAEEKGLVRPDIVFSSHVHNYERHKHRGIQYVVSGGGGAPQYSVRRDGGDFYTGSSDNFHYCKITVSKTEAVFEMVRLDADTGKWAIGDTFTLSAGKAQ